jgi:hypothetical protein
MFMVPAFLLGALIGAFRAHKKQGNKLDMLQYGAAHGMVFFIVSLFASIALDWAGWV